MMVKNNIIFGKKLLWDPKNYTMYVRAPMCVCVCVLCVYVCVCVCVCVWCGVCGVSVGVWVVCEGV